MGNKGCQALMRCLRAQVLSKPLAVTGHDGLSSEENGTGLNEWSEVTRSLSEDKQWRNGDDFSGAESRAKRTRWDRRRRVGRSCTKNKSQQRLLRERSEGAREGESSGKDTEAVLDVAGQSLNKHLLETFYTLGMACVQGTSAVSRHLLLHCTSTLWVQNKNRLIASREWL